jgi:hypothetical protein
VLNHAWDVEIDQGRLASQGQKCLHFGEPRNREWQVPDFLDDVPVMSATVLALDMIVHEPHIDLTLVSELVLSDVGATIKTFQMIRWEYESAEDRPSRMVDCLASLDMNLWSKAISSRLFACDREHASTTAVWKHSRLVARYAQLVAESLIGISPEEAYLVGLLHGFEAIPPVIELQSLDGARAIGVLLAIEEVLPSFVISAIHGVNDSVPSSQWSFILNAAHELASSGAHSDSSICGRRRYQDIGYLC